MKLTVRNIILFGLLAFTLSCNDNTVIRPVLTDNFDRTEMLEFWSDEIIIPSYESYVVSLQEFQSSASHFYEYPDQVNLGQLRSAWLKAYLGWQSVSMFEIGKAEEIGLRNYTNIYPTDTEQIHTNIYASNLNLDLPSNFSTQGFPALDYLLYGPYPNDESVINMLTDEKVEAYVKTLINRLQDMTSVVLEDWKKNYKITFVSNDGSSATASTDKMVNDFLYYYEKFLRAAKVGMPAGIFSGNETVDLVEGRYSSIYSKQLFEKGFATVRLFFNGISYDGQTEGVSLKQYLDRIHEDNQTDLDIAESILTQWEMADMALNAVNESFKEQVINDNSKMLALYDELQKAVVILKVDMLQALNIQVDFVDADGD